MKFCKRSDPRKAAEKAFSRHDAKKGRSSRSKTRLGQSLFCLAPLAVCMALLMTSAVTRADDAGFVPLFNGENLDGWDGDGRLWTATDGEIVGSTEGASISKNSFLIFDGIFSDFVLRAKVKLRNHNSGIQFRSEGLDGYSAAGYQADIAEANYFGMLYEERKRGFMDYWAGLTDAEKAYTQSIVNKEGWNEFEITCRGDRVKIVLNGHTTVDIRDPEGARRGVIALQLHTGPAMEVRFKDIALKEIDTKLDAPLMPDYDAVRRERLVNLGGRFRTPDGFSVEEVASDELVGSVINMTFDHLGRLVVSSEDGGIRILIDEDGDGIFDSQKSFSEDVQTAMGMHYLGPGDLLVHSKGPDGAALYRLTDTDGDDEADQIETIMVSNGGIGEHGPHAILTGPDGYLYILYGNHAHPKEEVSPRSPLRGLEEDFLLPRYLDPRGHANRIRAPGGTILRVSPDLTEWNQLVGGYRNPFDMAMDRYGEIFTFDSDMEWDLGLPWYRPIRVIHAVPGGDYGWRTGSSKIPDYAIDTLPGVDDIGRGSPVGMCFYEHDAYPERFRGALFTGDWTRGRIRVLFPRRSGATYEGKSVDFVLGEPLNVTDMDVGPDGMLYFTMGGRGTHGGVFRVRYGDAREVEKAPSIDGVTSQPMPRSAWGKYAIALAKNALGATWESGLYEVVGDENAPTDKRLRALEALQVHGPAFSVDQLRRLARDNDPQLRAAAVFQLGAQPLEDARRALTNALEDEDPFVARRACEALIRAGMDFDVPVRGQRGIARRLLELIDHPDRFLRYAARHALIRIPRDEWADDAALSDLAARPYGTFEGLLALIFTQQTAADANEIFAKLEELSGEAMDDETMLRYLRVLQLALIRDDDARERPTFTDRVGARLVSEFPRADWRVNRELQIALAHFQTPGAIASMLAYLTPEKSQEEQIHTAYALRVIKDGWNGAQRNQFVSWFDHAREIRGAASMVGFIDNIWESTLEILPADERRAAEERKADALLERRELALALIEETDGETPKVNSELAQMSFAELSEYLEFDPMSYRPGGYERGEKVFVRSRCASCHVFGSIGRGGGPDLSTVTSRFRRRDILESIMFPSRVISDQYTGVEIDLNDLSIVTGMVVGEGSDSLTLITALGERIDVRKRDIVEQREAKSSIMPEGLLNTMSLGELVDLMKFLERGSDL